MYNRLRHLSIFHRLNNENSRLFRGNKFVTDSMFIYHCLNRSLLSKWFEGRHLGILPSILGYVYYHFNWRMMLCNSSFKYLIGIDNLTYIFFFLLGKDCIIFVSVLHFHILNINYHLIYVI